MKRSSQQVSVQSLNDRELLVTQPSTKISVCPKCGESSLVHTKAEEVRYEGLGIPVLLTNSVINLHCTKCDHRAHDIPDLNGLVAAVALARVASPIKLNATEIIFLRKSLGCKASELAVKMDTDPATFSRWEKGHQVMGPKSELMLRLLVAGFMSVKAPAVDVDFASIVEMKLNPIQDSNSSPLSFELVKFKDKREKRQEWDLAELVA